jgi:hypothetical protein
MSSDCQFEESKLPEISIRISQSSISNKPQMILKIYSEHKNCSKLHLEIIWSQTPNQLKLLVWTKKIAVNCIGNHLSNPKSMEFLVWTEIIAVNCIGNHLSNPKSLIFFFWTEIIAVNNNIYTSQNYKSFKKELCAKFHNFFMQPKGSEKSHLSKKF